MVEIIWPWKGFFSSYIKKVAFKRRTPLLEIPDRIDLLWHLEFQSDSSKIASATKTFKMWSKQPSIVVGVCNRDGFLRVSHWLQISRWHWEILGVYLKSMGGDEANESFKYSFIAIWCRYQTPCVLWNKVMTSTKTFIATNQSSQAFFVFSLGRKIPSYNQGKIKTVTS